MLLPLQEKTNRWRYFFLTAFPCGPDSLTNELVIRKIDIPYLQLIQDDLDGVAGMETRLESFLDIIERKKST